MELTAWIAEGASADRSRLEAALNQERLVSQQDPRQVVEDEEAYETLVADHRESLRPAQHVEHKLVSMLQTSAVFISHLQKDARPQLR